MIRPDLHDKLAALDPRDLVDFIVDLQGRDDAIDRRIATLVAHLDTSAESQRLFGWIDVLSRRGYVDWRESPAFANEIDDLLDAVEALSAHRPREARLVIDRLLDTAPRLIEDSDDSGGDIGFALERAYVGWLRVAALERQHVASEIDWPDRVRRLHAEDGYGLADQLLSESGILLTESELRRLAAHYAAGTTLGDRAALGQIALALRDAKLYARSMTLLNPEPNELQKADIVETCLRLEAADEALTWLGGSWQDEVRRLTLRAEVFAARGERDREMEARRLVWRQRCSWETLEPLLDRVDPGERESLIAAAVARCAEADIRHALKILLQLEKLDAAAELAIERHKELGSIFYTSLSNAAADFERHEHALAATLAYRALLDDILRRGHSKAYHHAARYYIKLGELHRSIVDWRSFPNHTAYVGGLRDSHGRKRSFWGRVDGPRRVS